MEIESSFIPVRPVRPLAPWIGGKRHLADRIVEMIGRMPHRHYAEAFVGQGGIFLRRPFRPHSEAINDISRDVTTLFRILQRHYVSFLEMIKWQLSSRAEFERLAATPPEMLTDLERSARFLYLQRTAFGGKVRGRNFGVDATSPASFDVTKLQPLLEAVHERLSGVTIECLPWAEFLERYDHPERLFYLDPPYWGSEDDYGTGLWRRSDFARLAARLRALKGRFLLSINDVPEVRQIFAGFWMQEVSTTYSVAGGSSAAAELLIAREEPGRGRLL
jgi:DNA adenine methylase